jgi:hypothetical protein
MRRRIESARRAGLISALTAVSAFLGDPSAEAQTQGLGEPAPSGIAVVPSDPTRTETVPAGPTGFGEGIGPYFQDWFNRVDAALASQPIWAAPLVMATPRVVELFRFDTSVARVRNGVELDNYGLGRGLSLVPNETTQVSLGIPAYDIRTGGRAPGSGFADLPFITVKERLVSANAQNGDYIVTAFLGGSAPTGIALYTDNAYMISPGLYAGKGWGRFDIQGSIGGSFPVAGQTNIGNAMVSNLVFQYHVGSIFWPEIEFNNTYWFDGVRKGKSQTFMTVGLLLSRFHLFGRFNLSVGGGYQFALTPAFVTKPVVTPVYAHAWVTTFRFIF